MNTNFVTKTALFTSAAATIRQRMSPAKDDANANSDANRNGNDPFNGNGNAELEGSKSNKKKKKNKKRNSRASLTAEDDVSGGGNGDGDSAPSPTVAVVADTNEYTDAAAADAPADVAWSSPAKDEVVSSPSPLLDLPSPTPVSSGSPFDVFDSLTDADTTIATTTASQPSSFAALSTSTPAADAVSARPAVDLAHLFASPAPPIPARRSPPPLPPAPVAVPAAAPVPVSAASSQPHTPVLPAQSTPPLKSQPTVEATPISEEPSTAPPAEVESARIEAPMSPPQAIAAEAISPPRSPVLPAEPTPPYESPMAVETTPISVESLTAPAKAIESAIIEVSASFPKAAANESISPTTDPDVEIIALEASTPSTPTPAAVADFNPAPNTVEREAIIPENDEPARTPAASTFVETTAATANGPTATMAAFTDTSEVEYNSTHADDAAAVDVQVHLDTAADSPAEESPPSSPAPLPSSAEDDNVAVESDSLPAALQAASPPPAPVAARAQMISPTAVRLSKPPSHGASTTGVKTALKKPAAPTKQVTNYGIAAVSGKPASKTPTAPRTPTKQMPKPTATSPSTAPVRPKAAVSKTPTLQRSLSGSTAVKKPARSPTSSTTTTLKNGSSSPTTGNQAAGDNEPKVIKKKLSASEIDAAGNRLYEQAMESKRRLEAKKALQEEEFTFTPQVNQSKSKKLDNGDAPNRFVMLHERAKEAQRKKEELREKLEKEECSFKPQITNKARKIASSSDKPRFENLYRNAQEIQARRDEKKQELQKNEEELTFKPKIKATKSPIRSRPLYDEELVKQRRLEREQKKMEAELLAKPKVVKKTKAPDGDNKFFDRLYQAGQERAERLAKLKQEREDQEMANTTFKPKVSSARSTGKPSTQPFHQRLFDKDHLKKVAAEREQKKLDEEKKRFSFKPQVSDIPDGVKSKGSSEGGSTTKSSIFERLYQDKNRVKEKIDLSEELKIQKEMEECTFRPQIDPPASGGGKGESATPIWERLLSIDKNQIAEERDRLKAQHELEACTFRPEISLTPGSVSPKRASMSNIFDRLSTSAGNTPVDEKKRRPSDRKAIAVDGKRNSYSEVGVADPEGSEGNVIEC